MFADSMDTTKSDPLISLLFARIEQNAFYKMITD
jgi:hypothetical protein